MGNLKAFYKHLDNLEEKINTEIKDTVKDVVLETHKALLEPKEVGGTPVQTSWLRSNWIISFNTPQPFPVGSKINVAAAKSAQQKSISQLLQSELKNVKTIYLNNGVPYGYFVNYGTKKQSGQGFREESIQRGLKRLKTSRVIK